MTPAPTASEPGEPRFCVGQRVFWRVGFGGDSKLDQVYFAAIVRALLPDGRVVIGIHERHLPDGGAIWEAERTVAESELADVNEVREARDSYFAGTSPKRVGRA